MSTLEGLQRLATLRTRVAAYLADPGADDADDLLDAILDATDDYPELAADLNQLGQVVVQKELAI